MELFVTLIVYIIVFVIMYAFLMAVLATFDPPLSARTQNIIKVVLLGLVLIMVLSLFFNVPFPAPRFHWEK